MDKLYDEEVNRYYILCDICKGRIYVENNEWYGDDHWELDGKIICEDCIHDYVRSKKRTL